MVVEFDEKSKGVYTRLKMKRTNIHLSDNQLEKLEKIRKDTGLSVAEHVRRAIDDYLKKLAES